MQCFKGLKKMSIIVSYSGQITHGRKRIILIKVTALGKEYFEKKSRRMAKHQKNY